MSRRRLGRALRASIEPGRDIELLAATLARRNGLALMDAARRHRVIGYLHAATERVAEVEPTVRAGIEDAYAEGTHTHFRALADVSFLAGVLGRAGIPWLVVKGPVLAETAYPRFDLRTYRDLDVLVPPGSFARTLHILEGEGGHVLDRNWSRIHADLRGEVHVVLPNGSLCDLHWHLLHSRDERRQFRLPTDELLDRATHVDLGGLAAMTLGPADALIHLALHACLSGGDRVVWYLDIANAVENWRVPWDEVVARGRVTRTGLPVAAILAVARHRFAAAVPPEVLRALDPAGVWSTLVRAAVAVRPPETGSGGGSPGRLVCRASRPTLGASLWELARRTAGWLRAPLDSTAAARANRGGPADRGGARFPSGGETARRAYLAEVGLLAGSQHRAASHSPPETRKLDERALIDRPGADHLSEKTGDT